MATERTKSGPRPATRRRTLLRAFFLAVLLSALGAAALALAESEAWVTYTNPRFGTTTEYPAHLFVVRDLAPANGDGQGFRTEDGRAQLLIYGAHNAENDTPQSYLERYVDLEGVSVSYRRVTATFYVVSGRRGDSIMYERCNFTTGGLIHCIGILYPVDEKETWDPIVTRLAASLRARRGIDPRS